MQDPKFKKEFLKKIIAFFDLISGIHYSENVALRK